MTKDNKGKEETTAKLEEHLEIAMQRIATQKEQRIRPQLEVVYALASQKEQIHAAVLHARKERQYSAEEEGDGQGPSSDNQSDQLHLDIDDRQTALINHRIVKDAMQKAAFNIQMQDTVRNSLQKVDVEETMDNLTERGVLLAHCGSNLQSSKELAAVQEEIANLNKDILQLHLKYSSILKKIKPKWEALQDRYMKVGEENKVLVHMRDKAQERKGKIQLLVVIIQALVSTCGFHWGAFEYYVQLMLLCDSAVMHQDATRQDAIMNEINMICDRKKKEDNRGTVKEMLSAIKSKE